MLVGLTVIAVGLTVLTGVSLVTNVSEFGTHRFEEKVALVQVYPGIEPEVIDFYVDKGYKGIVLGATALGHVPQKLYPNIEKAIKSNVPVVIASQTLYGRTHPLVYAALRELSIRLGCIFVEDMMPEVAYIKLGWVLGQTKEKEKIKEMMLENIAGEITGRSSVLIFPRTTRKKR